MKIKISDISVIVMRFLYMKYALTKNLLENLAELLGEEYPKVMALKSEYRMKQNSMTREKNYSILCCKKVDMSLL